MKRSSIIRDWKYDALYYGRCCLGRIIRITPLSNLFAPFRQMVQVDRTALCSFIGSVRFTMIDSSHADHTDMHNAQLAAL
jgi:hypothetical protein